MIFLGLTIAYWAAALISYAAVQRMRRAIVQPESVAAVSEDELVITYADSLSIGRVLAVALIPPAVAVVAWMILR